MKKSRTHTETGVYVCVDQAKCRAREERRRLFDTVAKQMWSLGKIDKEIAEKLGVVISTVCTWRRKNGLPANAPTGSDDWKASRSTFINKGTQTLETNSRGLTDVQAAEEIGITAHAYRQRRVRMGLKINRQRKRRKKNGPGNRDSEAPVERVEVFADGGDHAI